MKLSDVEIVVQIRRKDTGQVLFGRRDDWDGVEGHWHEVHESFNGDIEPDDRAQTVRRGLLRAVDGGAAEVQDQLEQNWGLSR